MAEQNTTDKLTLAKFEEAYDIVHKVVLPTKLIYSDYFSGITGNKVYFLSLIHISEPTRRS